MNKKKGFVKLISGTLSCMLLVSAPFPKYSVSANELATKSAEFLGLNPPTASTTVNVGYKGTIAPEEIVLTLTPEEAERAIQYATGKQSAPEIRVEVVWDELKFTYDFGTVIKYDWNFKNFKYLPTYSYENGEGPGWDKEYVNFTFTNHSNRDVKTAVEFTKNTNTDIYDDVTLTPDNEHVHLSSAVGRSTENLDTDSIKLYISEHPNDDMKKYTDENMPHLGTVNFSVEALPLDHQD